MQTELLINLWFYSGNQITAEELLLLSEMDTYWWDSRFYPFALFLRLMSELTQRCHHVPQMSCEHQSGER